MTDFFDVLFKKNGLNSRALLLNDFVVTATKKRKVCVLARMPFALPSCKECRGAATPLCGFFAFTTCTSKYKIKRR